MMNQPNEIEACRVGLAGLLPAGQSFAVAAVSDRLDTEWPQDAVHLLQAAAHRRAEFSSGRACARHALAQLGVADCALPADAAGVPQWPAGYLASISHSRGLVAAVAGSTKQLQCLGLDLEQTQRLSQAAIARVVHPDEAGWVGQSTLRASLLFSAKEAFYKAQYPRWSTAANFSDICFSVDEQSCKLKIVWLAERFAPDLHAQAASMQLRYAYFGRYVVSLCWL
jgi:4'-phosphopantetheinyl transferase EntD